MLLYLYINTVSRPRGSSLLFCNNIVDFILYTDIILYFIFFLTQAFLKAPLKFIMSFAICGAFKHKGNLANAFSTISQYLKYFKDLLVDPFTLCLTALSKKNYDYYNKGFESYKLISFLLLNLFSKIRFFNAFLKFLSPF